MKTRTAMLIGFATSMALASDYQFDINASASHRLDMVLSIPEFPQPVKRSWYLSPAGTNSSPMSLPPLSMGYSHSRSHGYALSLKPVGTVRGTNCVSAELTYKIRNFSDKTETTNSAHLMIPLGVDFRITHDAVEVVGTWMRNAEAEPEARPYGSPAAGSPSGQP
jgi:hypothetical protein